MSFLPLLQSDLSLFDGVFDRTSAGPSFRTIVPLEIESDSDAVYVRAEVPGLRKEDIVVEYQDGILSLSGEKIAETRKAEKGYHYTETRTGKFSRKIQVGHDVRFDQAEAHYENGVLRITIPREKQTPVNRLTIR